LVGSRSCRPMKDAPVRQAAPSGDWQKCLRTADIFGTARCPSSRHPVPPQDKVYAVPLALPQWLCSAHGGFWRERNVYARLRLPPERATLFQGLKVAKPEEAFGGLISEFTGVSYQSPRGNIARGVPLDPTQMACKASTSLLGFRPFFYSSASACCLRTDIKRTEVLIATPMPETSACMLPVSMRCSVDLSETAFPLRPCTMSCEFSKVRARPSMPSKSLSHGSAHFLLH
jgi:hypothetical protein